MSTHYKTCPQGTVVFSDIFDGRLEQFGIEESSQSASNSVKRYLTDGHNYLQVHADEEGYLADLVHLHLFGRPGKILRAIAYVFQVNIVSEDEPEFWGFCSYRDYTMCIESFYMREDPAYLIEEFLKHKELFPEIEFIIKRNQTLQELFNTCPKFVETKIDDSFPP